MSSNSYYQEFIKNYLKPNPGKIIDVATGNVIGTHTGLMNYTIGVLNTYMSSNS